MYLGEALLSTQVAEGGLAEGCSAFLGKGGCLLLAGGGRGRLLTGWSLQVVGRAAEGT